MRKSCLMCGKELRSDGECPDGCTEDAGYDVMEGVCRDERDIKTLSLMKGCCLECGAELNCPNGCYDPTDYIAEDGESNEAIAEGICLACGGKVDCVNGCLNPDEDFLTNRRFHVGRADQLKLFEKAI